LLDRAVEQGGNVLLSLYELDDRELVDLLIENRKRIEVILSNSSADKETHAWDFRNAPARAKLVDAGVALQNRLFNNRHIGHNKFAVYVDGGGNAQAVLTGSTNWTSLGLCGQSNNAVIFENPKVASAYLRYWKRLKDDPIRDPEPPSAPGHSNVQ